VCNESPGWHKVEDDSRHQLVFPCLVRNLYAEDEDSDIAVLNENDHRGVESASKLSIECTHAVEKTLKQRAMSANLHPEIEQACRFHLHTLCTSHVQPGAELECLQDHYRDINRECQAVVDKYTIIEARNPQLHPVIIGACANLIERRCGQESEVEDGSGVMECLIRHKIEHPQGTQGSMNNKCRTVLEHWQILSLEDWRFTFGFKHSCKDDIRKHCFNPRPKKKLEVVGCLVAIISKDTMMEEKQRVKKACRDQIKFELLQKHSSIKLDLVLAEACNTELAMLCPKKDQAEDGGLECLKNMKPSDLSIKCRKELFQEEKEEAMDNQVDFALIKGCKREIKEHCDEEDPQNIIKCLKDFSEESNFAAKCRDIIQKRITQCMQDYI
jgi:Golgi apparatus protein 1